jgi:hypothetical protein
MEGTSMRGICAGSLGIVLGILGGKASAEELTWQPATRSPGKPAVTLGKPVAVSPATGSGYTDRQLTPASYSPAALAAPQPVIRAQAPDPIGSTPPPPGPVAPPLPTIPTTSNEPFNCGVVNDSPTGSHPILNGINNFFGGCKNLVTGIYPGGGGGRNLFESDHGFDVFSSPVSNPFLFEDPRSLTEVRPIFMHQGTPTTNPIFHGGDIEFFGVQARLAFTERLSLVINELGIIWDEPHNPGSGFGGHDGWSELRIGPKYTFYRCEQSGTIAAAGLNFDIPIGPAKVFQNTGNLSLEPYVSFGQNFWKTNYGSVNFLGTIGFSVGMDNQRSDFLFASLHLDYDVANLRKVYPFIDFNLFDYTGSGKATDLGFEGRDLFNFGSHGVSGHNNFSMATGLRYKFTENIQTGLGVEFPLNGRKDLLDYRINVDVIFRY